MSCKNQDYFHSSQELSCPLEYGRAPWEIVCEGAWSLEREKLENVDIMAFKIHIFVRQVLSRNEMSSSRGRQTFSVKGQIVSIFAGHVISDTTTQLYHGSLKADINKM